MPNNSSVHDKYLFFHHKIQPKLTRRALQLAGFCQFTSEEILAATADIFVSKVEYLDNEGQIVRYATLLMLQHCRRTGITHRPERKAAKNRQVGLDALADLADPGDGDQLSQHVAGRMALLEQAMERQGWVDEPIRAAVELLWAGATLAETAQALRLSPSCLHKTLRRFGRQLLGGERPVVSAYAGSRRRRRTDEQQLDLFAAVGV